MRHFLTIDVESRRRGLGDEPSGADPSLVPALELLLQRLAEWRVSATFFVLAEDAAEVRSVLPAMIRSGHEVACHGLRHVRADALAPDAFRADVREAKARIEDLSQSPCLGYRAPFFSAPADTDRFLHALADEGFAYDASLRRPLSAPPIASARIREFAVPLVPCGPFPTGVLGGLSLRLLPRRLILRLFRACENRGRAGVVYLHPYEWFPGTAEPTGDLLSCLRRRYRVSSTLPRLAWLLRAAEFVPLRSALPL